MRKFFIRHRYAVCCLLSAAASMLSFVNPLLAGGMINRVMTSYSIPSATPYVIGMAVVNGSRIALRSFVASFLRGKQRAPLIWIQNRIGKWLWWLEPALHGWGYPGILMKKLGRFLAAHAFTANSLALGKKLRKNRRFTLSIASSITYTLADFFVTALAGVIFYYTRNTYASMLAVLLPVVAVIPWFAKKNQRLTHLRKHAAA